MKTTLIRTLRRLLIYKCHRDIALLAGAGFHYEGKQEGKDGRLSVVPIENACFRIGLKWPKKWRKTTVVGASYSPDEGKWWGNMAWKPPPCSTIHMLGLWSSRPPGWAAHAPMQPYMHARAEHAHNF